jgi:ankyrin repeat protein
MSRLAMAALCALAVAATALAFLHFVVIGRSQPESALARAAAAADGERVRALARAGAALDAPDASGFTALDWAARNDRVEAIQALVAAGADPDALDSGPNGWTPLIHAVHKQQAAAVRALLAAGADPNARARNGGVALMDAAMRGDLTVVEILLAAGADPLVRSHGRTALTNAVAGGNPAVVLAMRRKAPTLRLRNTLWDHMAVWIARLSGHGEAIAALRTSVEPPQGSPRR